MENILKELKENLGINIELTPDNKNLDEILQQTLSRIKVLHSANRDLKNNYTQLKQEMEQINAAKTDENEKDRLIRDLSEKVSQLRESILKLSSEYQKLLTMGEGGPGITSMLQKIDEFKQSQTSAQDLEQKLISQRTLNAKIQKEDSDKIATLELHLNEAQTKLKQNEATIVELNKQKEQAASQSVRKGADVQELQRIMEENNNFKLKLTEINGQFEPVQSENKRLKEKLDQLKDTEGQLQEKSQVINELNAEVEQKIRQIESMKNEIGRIQELEEKIKVISDQTSLKENQLQEMKKQYQDLLNQSESMKNRAITLENQIKESSGSIEAFKQKQEGFEQLQRDFSALQQQMQLKNSEIERLSGLIDESTKKVDRVSKVYTRMQEENVNSLKLSGELKQENDLKQARIDDLDGELKAQKAEYAKLREEFGRAGADKSASMKELNNQLINKEKMVEDLKQEIQEYEKKITQMVYKEELTKTQEELTAKSKQLEEKIEKLSEKDNEILAIQEHVDQLSQGVKQKEGEFQAQTFKRQELEDALKEKVDEIKVLHTQLEKLQQTAKELEQLKAEFTEAAQRVQEMLSQKEVLYDQIRNLKNDQSGDKAVIKRLEQKISDLQGKGMKENVEIELLRKKVDELNAQLRQEISKASESVGKSGAFREQLDKLYPQIEDYKKQIDTLKDKMNFIEKKSLEDQSGVNTQLKNKEKECQTLAEKLKIMEGDLIKAKEGEKFKEEIIKIRRQIAEQNGINDRLADDVAKYKTEILVMKKENERMKEEAINFKRRIKVLRRESGQPG